VNIRLECKNTTTQNRHKELKPSLFALYNLCPGNGAGPLPGSTWNICSMYVCLMV